MNAITVSRVAAKCDKSPSTIWRWANSPDFAHLNFPKPFQIGDNSTVWDEADIDAWLSARKAAA